MQARYSRQEILKEIGVEGQKRLQQSHALLVGVGGLGCPVLQYLVAAGVGRITVLDDDVVDVSNLQRQVLFAESEVGERKVLIAKQKMQALNPAVDIEVFAERLTVVNARALIADCNLVIDGSDNFGTSYLVNDACVELGVPFIFGSLFKFEGQITICNVAGGPTYRCLYPEPPAPEDAPSCAEAGILGSVAGTVGCLMAQEALKYLIGFGDLLSGKLLTLNLNDFSLRKIGFKRSLEAEVTIADQQYYDGLNGCGIVSEITYEQLQQMMQEEDVHLIDVREKWERDQFHIGGEHVPLDKIVDREVCGQKTLVMYCASGMRSMQACAKMQAMRPGARLFNLKGGLAKVA
jgi:adenylyltransferase/sulfurtransferase